MENTRLITFRTPFMQYLTGFVVLVYLTYLSWSAFSLSLSDNASAAVISSISKVQIGSFCATTIYTVVYIRWLIDFFRGRKFSKSLEQVIIITDVQDV